MSEINIKIIKTNFSFPPYHINAYLIKTKWGNFLFDTSIKTETSIETIINTIKENGGIDGIILSHGHLDHAGCSAIISDKFDVPIYVSLEEKERISSDFNLRMKRRINKIIKIADYLGLDKNNTQKEYEKINYYRNILTPIDFCFNIDRLNIPDFKILRLPGHTNGSIGIYITSKKILLSGDALLEDGISPFFDPDLLENSILTYENSLNMLKNLEITQILPGHGNPIYNAQKTIQKHTNYIHSNRERIKSLLQQNKDITTIYNSVFPKNYNLLIALSEIIGALEELQIPILQNLKDLLSE
jgi:glyoxylase-like metal-dependent hydrolase (beta-lactamase superfamily II)